MKNSSLALFSLLLISTLLQASEGTWETWKAPGVLAQILTKDPSFTELKWQGTVPKELDASKSQCILKVFRPALLAEAETNPENTLVCELVGTDGTEAILTWNLTDAPFSAWGNRAAENYCKTNKISCPFQILNHALNEKLFHAFQVSKSNPQVTTLTICDPTGRICGTDYALEGAPKGEHATTYLTCTIDTEGEKIYRTRCTFFYP